MLSIDDDVDIYEYDSFVKDNDPFEGFVGVIKHNVAQQQQLQKDANNTSGSRKKRKQLESSDQSNKKSKE